MKQIQIDTHFHLFLIFMLRNPAFSCRVKIPYQQLLIFLSFVMERITSSYYSSMVS